MHAYSGIGEIAAEDDQDTLPIILSPRYFKIISCSIILL